MNGEPFDGLKEEKDALVYCCDGAYLWSKDKIHIDENIGDFDSLSVPPVPAPKEVYPSEKDFTDGEIALFRMLKHGVDEIVIYGGGGKREDHFLGNLHLMYYAFERGVPCQMETGYSTMYFARGECGLDGIKGRTVSLLPFFGDALVESSYGLHYPLKNLWLTAGSCRGISNLADGERAGFRCTRGTVLVCIDKKKKGENGG